MTEKRKQKMSSLITMSAITGKPNTEKIHGYLKDLKENGIDEFLLYPRSGCEIEYLSNEWFDTVEKFVNLMNKEAKELGMNNTVFSNPHGLDEFDEGNISCALDMTVLLSILLNNKTFLSIEKLDKYNSMNHGVWFNKNKLMKQYKYTTSCKTGVAPVFCEI